MKYPTRRNAGFFMRSLELSYWFLGQNSRIYFGLAATANASLLKPLKMTILSNKTLFFSWDFLVLVL